MKYIHDGHHVRQEKKNCFKPWSHGNMHGACFFFGKIFFLHRLQSLETSPGLEITPGWWANVWQIFPLYGSSRRQLDELSCWFYKENEPERTCSEWQSTRLVQKGQIVLWLLKLLSAIWIFQPSSSCCFGRSYQDLNIYFNSANTNWSYVMSFASAIY